MDVLSPLPQALRVSEHAAVANAPRLVAIDGRRIGYVDNGWEALDLLFGHVQEALEARHGCVPGPYIESHDIISASQLAEMVEHVDAAVVGLGN